MPNWWIRLGAIACIGWLARQVTMDQLPAISIILSFMVVLRILVSTAASHLIICGTKPDNSDSYAPTRWLLALLQSEQVQRISKFTYAIYLLNPIVIMYVYHSFSNEVYPDNTMMVSQSQISLIFMGLHLINPLFLLLDNAGYLLFSGLLPLGHSNDGALRDSLQSADQCDD